MFNPHEASMEEILELSKFIKLAEEAQRYEAVIAKRYPSNSSNGGYVGSSTEREIYDSRYVLDESRRTGFVPCIIPLKSI